MLSLLQEAMELREPLMPLCHTMTAEALYLLANAHHGLRQYAEADRCYRQASDYLFQLLPSDHPYIKEVVGNWMASNAEWGARSDLNTYGDGRQSA